MNRVAIMDDKMKEWDISDVLIERPVGFTYNRRHYCLYPLTLGTIQLVTRFLSKLGLENMKDDGRLFTQLLLSASCNREDCIRVLSYLTLPGAGSLDEEKVGKRMKEFRKMPASDVASIIITALTSDKTKLIGDYYGIYKESKRLEKVMKIKKDDGKGSVSFGAKSVWGTLIDFACQRYGWTYQYVLWGISYANLQLLMLDQEKTLFLSEEERRKAGALVDGQPIKADDSSAFMTFIKTQSWK